MFSYFSSLRKNFLKYNNIYLFFSPVFFLFVVIIIASSSTRTAFVGAANLDVNCSGAYLVGNHQSIGPDSLTINVLPDCESLTVLNSKFQDGRLRLTADPRLPARTNPISIKISNIICNSTTDSLQLVTVTACIHFDFGSLANITLIEVSDVYNYRNHYARYSSAVLFSGIIASSVLALNFANINQISTFIPQEEYGVAIFGSLKAGLFVQPGALSAAAIRFGSPVSIGNTLNVSNSRVQLNGIVSDDYCHGLTATLCFFASSFIVGTNDSTETTVGIFFTNNSMTTSLDNNNNNNNNNSGLKLYQRGASNVAAGSGLNLVLLLAGSTLQCLGKNSKIQLSNNKMAMKSVQAIANNSQTTKFALNVVMFSFPYTNALAAPSIDVITNTINVDRLGDFESNFSSVLIRNANDNLRAYQKFMIASSSTNNNNNGNAKLFSPVITVCILSLVYTSGVPSSQRVDSLVLDSNLLGPSTNVMSPFGQARFYVAFLYVPMPQMRIQRNFLLLANVTATAPSSVFAVVYCYWDDAQLDPASFLGDSPSSSQPISYIWNTYANFVSLSTSTSYTLQYTFGVLSVKNSSSTENNSNKIKLFGSRTDAVTHVGIFIFPTAALASIPNSGALTFSALADRVEVQNLEVYSGIVQVIGHVLPKIYNLSSAVIGMIKIEASNITAVESSLDFRAVSIALLVHVQNGGISNSLSTMAVANVTMLNSKNLAAVAPDVVDSSALKKYFGVRVAVLRGVSDDSWNSSSGIPSGSGGGGDITVRSNSIGPVQNIVLQDMWAVRVIVCDIGGDFRHLAGKIAVSLNSILDLDFAEVRLVFPNTINDIPIFRAVLVNVDVPSASPIVDVGGFDVTSNTLSSIRVNLSTNYAEAITQTKSSFRYAGLSSLMPKSYIGAMMVSAANMNQAAVVTSERINIIRAKENKINDVECNFYAAVPFDSSSPPSSSLYNVYIWYHSSYVFVVAFFNSNLNDITYGIAVTNNNINNVVLNAPQQSIQNFANPSYFLSVIDEKVKGTSSVMLPLVGSDVVVSVCHSDRAITNVSFSFAVDSNNVTNVKSASFENTRITGLHVVSTDPAQYDDHGGVYGISWLKGLLSLQLNLIENVTIYSGLEFYTRLGTYDSNNRRSNNNNNTKSILPPSSLFTSSPSPLHQSASGLYFLRSQVSILLTPCVYFVSSNILFFGNVVNNILFYELRSATVRTVEITYSLVLANPFSKVATSSSTKVVLLQKNRISNVFFLLSGNLQSILDMPTIPRIMTVSIFASNSILGSNATMFRSGTSAILNKRFEFFTSAQYYSIQPRYFLLCRDHNVGNIYVLDDSPPSFAGPNKLVLPDTNYQPQLVLSGFENSIVEGVLFSDFSLVDMKICNVGFVGVASQNNNYSPGLQISATIIAVKFAATAIGGSTVGPFARYNSYTGDFKIGEISISSIFSAALLMASEKNYSSSLAKGANFDFFVPFDAQVLDSQNNNNNINNISRNTLNTSSLVIPSFAVAAIFFPQISWCTFDGPSSVIISNININEVTVGVVATYFYLAGVSFVSSVTNLQIRNSFTIRDISLSNISYRTANQSAIRAFDASMFVTWLFSSSAENNNNNIVGLHIVNIVVENISVQQTANFVKVSDIFTFSKFISVDINCVHFSSTVGMFSSSSPLLTSTNCFQISNISMNNIFMLTPNSASDSLALAGRTRYRVDAVAFDMYIANFYFGNVLIENIFMTNVYNLNTSPSLLNARNCRLTAISTISQGSLVFKNFILEFYLMTLFGDQNNNAPMAKLTLNSEVSLANLVFERDAVGSCFIQTIAEGVVFSNFSAKVSVAILDQIQIDENGKMWRISYAKNNNIKNEFTPSNSFIFQIFSPTKWQSISNVQFLDSWFSFDAPQSLTMQHFFMEFGSSKYDSSNTQQQQQNHPKIEFFGDFLQLANVYSHDTAFASGLVSAEFTDFEMKLNTNVVSKINMTVGLSLQNIGPQSTLTSDRTPTFSLFMSSYVNNNNDYFYGLVNISNMLIFVGETSADSNVVASHTEFIIPVFCVTSTSFKILWISSQISNYQIGLRNKDKMLEVRNTKIIVAPTHANSSLRIFTIFLVLSQHELDLVIVPPSTSASSSSSSSISTAFNTNNILSLESNFANIVNVSLVTVIDFDEMFGTSSFSQWKLATAAYFDQFLIFGSNLSATDLVVRNNTLIAGVAEATSTAVTTGGSFCILNFGSDAYLGDFHVSSNVVKIAEIPSFFLAEPSLVLFVAAVTALEHAVIFNCSLSETVREVTFERLVSEIAPKNFPPQKYGTMIISSIDLLLSVFAKGIFSTRLLVFTEGLTSSAKKIEISSCSLTSTGSFTSRLPRLEKHFLLIHVPVMPSSNSSMNNNNNNNITLSLIVADCNIQLEVEDSSLFKSSTKNNNSQYVRDPSSFSVSDFQTSNNSVISWWNPHQFMHGSLFAWLSSAGFLVKNILIQNSAVSVRTSDRMNSFIMGMNPSARQAYQLLCGSDNSTANVVLTLAASIPQLRRRTYSDDVTEAPPTRVAIQNNSVLVRKENLLVNSVEFCALAFYTKDFAELPGGYVEICDNTMRFEKIAPNNSSNNNHLQQQQNEMFLENQQAFSTASTNVIYIDSPLNASISKSLALLVQGTRARNDDVKYSNTFPLSTKAHAESVEVYHRNCPDRPYFVNVSLQLNCNDWQVGYDHRFAFWNRQVQLLQNLTFGPDCLLSSSASSTLTESTTPSSSRNSRSFSRSQFSSSASVSPRRSSSFSLSSQASRTVSISRDRTSSSSKSQQTQSLTQSHPLPRDGVINLPIPQAVSASVAAVALIGGSALAASAGPAFLVMFKASRVSSLLDCPNPALTMPRNPDDENSPPLPSALDELDLATNFLRFNFSGLVASQTRRNSKSGADETFVIDENAGTYIGALIGNFVLVVGILFAIKTITRIIVWYRKRKIGNNTNGIASPGNIQATNLQEDSEATIHDPGNIVGALDILGPGCVFAASCLFANSVNLTIFSGIVSALSLIVFLMFIPWWYWRTCKTWNEAESLIEVDEKGKWRKSLHQPKKKQNRNHLEEILIIHNSSKSKQSSKIRGKINGDKNKNTAEKIWSWVFSPWKEWEESVTVKKYGPIFDGYSNVYFSLVEWFAATLTGLFTGLATSCKTRKCCSTYGWLVLVVSCGSLILTLAVRPFMSRFDSVFWTSITALIATLSILQVILLNSSAAAAEAAAEKYPNLISAVQNIQSVIFIMSVVVLALEVVRTFIEVFDYFKELKKGKKAKEQASSMSPASASRRRRSQSNNNTKSGVESKSTSLKKIMKTTEQSNDSNNDSSLNMMVPSPNFSPRYQDEPKVQTSNKASLLERFESELVVNGSEKVKNQDHDVRQVETETKIENDQDDYEHVVEVRSNQPDDDYDDGEDVELEEVEENNNNDDEDFDPSSMEGEPLTTEEMNRLLGIQ